jgi:hypothetical protein
MLPPDNGALICIVPQPIAGDRAALSARPAKARTQTNRKQKRVFP